MLLTLALQLLDVDPQDQAEEDGSHMDLDAVRKGKCAVIKTSTRQVGLNHLHLLFDLHVAWPHPFRLIDV